MTTWLYRISINVAISFYRKNNNRTYFPVAEKLPTVFDPLPNDLQDKFNLLEQFIVELNEMGRIKEKLKKRSLNHKEN
jgi:RNA polymerase sigma-70 factor (ECF subfamily)